MYAVSRFFNIVTSEEEVVLTGEKNPWGCRLSASALSSASLLFPHSICVVPVTCCGHVWTGSYPGRQESAKERHSLTIGAVTKGFTKDAGSKGEFRGLEAK